MILFPVVPLISGNNFPLQPLPRRSRHLCPDGERRQTRFYEAIDLSKLRRRPTLYVLLPYLRVRLPTGFSLKITNHSIYCSFQVAKFTRWRNYVCDSSAFNTINTEMEMPRQLTCHCIFQSSHMRSIEKSIVIKNIEPNQVYNSRPTTTVTNSNTVQKFHPFITAISMSTVNQFSSFLADVKL